MVRRAVPGARWAVLFGLIALGVVGCARDAAPPAPDRTAVEAPELRRALDAWPADAFDDPDHPRHAEAWSAVVDAAHSVVAERSDASGGRDAWYWLLADALRRQDAEAVRPALDALEAHWIDDATFWDEHKMIVASARLLARGVPDFEATTLDGDAIDPASLRGRVVLLDFWATWCWPCLEQLPALQDVYAEHHEAGFEIVGISADDAERLDEAAFRAWLDENAVPWPQVYTGRGIDQELYRSFGIAGLPTTVLLDRDGRVVGVDLDGERLDETVAALL